MTPIAVAPHQSDTYDVPVLPHPKVDTAWLKQHYEEALEPDLSIVDSHHHLWDRGGGYLLDDLLADIGGGHRIVATVFAQCGQAYRSDGPAPLRPVGETEFVVQVAEEAQRRAVETKVCAAIIGFADLELGDDVDAVLAAHLEAGKGRLRGIRNITARHDAFVATLLGRPAADLLYRPSFRRGLSRLQAMELSFDAWLYHTQIDELVDLARDFPGLPIVLNHLGGPLGVGPYRGKRELAFLQWSASMQRLATCSNVQVKLGGLAMGVVGFSFHEKSLPPSSHELAEAWRPYIEHSIELFGARRCMFESNFPVDKGMCGYTVLWNAFKRIVAGATADEKAWLFKQTSNRFYRLNLVDGYPNQGLS